MKLQGLPAHEVEWQIHALTSADASKLIQLPQLSSDKVPKGAAAAPDEEGALDEPSPTTPASDTEASGPAPATPGADEAAHQRAVACLREHEVLPAPSVFVISIKTRGFRRLHVVGACRLVRGENYRNYVVYGDQMPAVGDFHARCRWCFGNGATDADELPSNSSSASSSSSSSADES